VLSLCAASGGRDSSAGCSSGGRRGVAAGGGGGGGRSSRRSHWDGRVVVVIVGEWFLFSSGAIRRFYFEHVLVCALSIQISVLIQHYIRAVRIDCLHFSEVALALLSLPCSNDLLLIPSFHHSTANRTTINHNQHTTKHTKLTHAVPSPIIINKQTNTHARLYSLLPQRSAGRDAAAQAQRQVFAPVQHHLHLQPPPKTKTKKKKKKQ
jgi:hypothetical protein